MRIMFATLLGLCLCADSGHTAEKPSLSSQTQASVSGGREGETEGHSGITLLTRDNVPAAAFFLNKEPKKKSQYAFLVLFKGTVKPTEVTSFSGGGRITNDSANMACKVKFDGKEAAIAYSFKAERGKPDFTEESLKLDGAEKKLADARVFLVDLTKDKIEFIPVPGDLPAAPGIDDKGSLQDLDKIVTAATEELKKRSPVVKKFFE